MMMKKVQDQKLQQFSFWKEVVHKEVLEGVNSRHRLTLSLLLGHGHQALKGGQPAERVLLHQEGERGHFIGQSSVFQHRFDPLHLRPGNLPLCKQDRPMEL